LASARFGGIILGGRSRKLPTEEVREAMDVVSFEELSPEVTAEARAAVVAADVVLGVDRQSQCEFTVFGMPSLESTVIMNRPSAMRILRVSLDSDKGELDKLLHIVRSVKGLDMYKHAQV
jgi:hypothetical protein